MQLSYDALIVLEYIEEESGISITRLIKEKENQLLRSDQIRNAVWELLDYDIIAWNDSNWKLYYKGVYPNWQRKQS